MLKLENEIKEFAIKNEFWGNISVIKNGETIIEQSHGFRDLTNKLPMKPDTSQGLASGTKSFTSVAIGVLVDQGKLELETTMKEIFGEDHSFIDSDATIHHLLCHTSGVFDYFDEETIEDFENFQVEIPWCLLETPSDYLPLFLDKPKKFNVGEKFSYSNGGYILLGIIIEKISKIKFRDFVQKHVLEPAGMENSGFFAFNDLPENTALGYIEQDGKMKSNIYNLPIRGGSDGGMYSTGSDIAKFWNALFANKIISEKLMKLFTKPQSRYEDWSCGYSYGYYLFGDNPGDSLNMVGCDSGVGFCSKYIIEDKIVISVLSNKSEGDAAVYGFIMEKYLDSIKAE